MKIFALAFILSVLANIGILAVWPETGFLALTAADMAIFLTVFLILGRGI